MEKVTTKEEAFLKFDEILSGIIEEYVPYSLSTVERVYGPNNTFKIEDRMKLEEFNNLIASLNPERNKCNSMLFEALCLLFTGDLEVGTYNGEYWQTYRDVFAGKLTQWITKDCEIPKESEAFKIIMDYTENYLEETSVEKMVEEIKKKWF